MRETALVCDGCGVAIVGSPGMPRNECMELHAVGVPTEASNVIFAIAMEPMLPHALHFHNRDCLKLWIDEALK